MPAGFALHGGGGRHHLGLRGQLAGGSVRRKFVNLDHLLCPGSLTCSLVVVLTIDLALKLVHQLLVRLQLRLAGLWSMRRIADVDQVARLAICGQINCKI